MEFSPGQFIVTVIGLTRNYIIYFHNLIFTSSNSNTGECHLGKGMQEVKI